MQGCNAKCSYCHNYSMIPKKDALFSYEEVISKLNIKKDKGHIDAVVVTGGEPTIHSGLIGFLSHLKADGFAVKLDTNGLLPQVLDTVLSNNLVDYVAMDIKTIPSRYIEVTREGLGQNVMKSLALLKAGAVPYECRTTVSNKVTPRDVLWGINTMLSDVDAPWYIQMDSGMTFYEKQQMESLCAEMKNAGAKMRKR